MTDSIYKDTVGRIATAPHKPVAPDQSTVLQTAQPQYLSSASSYADLNYLFGVQDTTMIAIVVSLVRVLSTRSTVEPEVGAIHAVQDESRWLNLPQLEEL
jgi:hypothetical protein